MPTKIRGFLLIKGVLRLIFALFIKGVLVSVIALVLVIVIEIIWYWSGPESFLVLIAGKNMWANTLMFQQKKYIFKNNGKIINSLNSK